VDTEAFPVFVCAIHHSGQRRDVGGDMRLGGVEIRADRRLHRRDLRTHDRLDGADVLPHLPELAM
jgi:hypothetical protein